MSIPSRLILALVALLAWSLPAAAASFTVMIEGFTNNAVATVQFSGSDSNGDGAIVGFYPPDTCTCFPGGLAFTTNEITSLSVAFSGNSLVSAFSGGTTDFNDPFQSLRFDGDFDGLSMIYIVDPNGTLPTSQDLPPGLVAGDMYISMFASLGVERSVILEGNRCGSAFGGLYGDNIPCAAVASGRLNDEVMNADFAFDAPEPASLALLGAAAGMLTAVRRRRR